MRLPAVDKEKAGKTGKAGKADRADKAGKADRAAGDRVAKEWERFPKEWPC